MMKQCSLLSLATAVPPFVIEQSEAKERGREAFGGKKALFDRLSGVFDNAGIARRHIVAPHDWYMPHTAGMTATRSIWKLPSGCSSTPRPRQSKKRG